MSNADLIEQGSATGAVASALPRRQSAIARFIRRQPAGFVSLVIILAWCSVAVLAPVIAPFPEAEFVGDPYQPPGGTYLFGTDQFGRDVFSRTLWGSRVSLFIGVVGAIVGVTTGATLGMLAGFVRGPFDTVVVRLVDGLQSIPALVFALVIVGSFGASLQNVLIGIVLIFIPTNARVARVVTRSIAARPFIEAARACGASSSRVLLRHIVPNVFPPMLVLYSLAVGGGIVVEATLSFLGVGVSPNVASWGSMIQASGIQTLASFWWVMLAPSLAIASAVYSANLFGDALRDQLDPRLRV